MSKYTPTGRPPGRPRKPEVERQNIQDVRARFKDATQDRAHMPLDAICPDCFPEGWKHFPADPVVTAQCVHGTWVKRL